MSKEKKILSFGEDTATMLEMLKFMKQSKAVKFAILGEFERYKAVHKDLIAKQLADAALSREKK